MTPLAQARDWIRSASVAGFDGGYWYDTDARASRSGPVGADDLARSLAHVIELRRAGAPDPSAGSGLGGVPRLPPGWAMPAGWSGYRFYLQIDLSEIAPLDRDQRLPPSGGVAWFQHESQAKCKLLYLPRTDDLVPCEGIPVLEDGRPARLTFAPRLVVYANQGDAYDYRMGLETIPADLRTRIEELYGCPFARDSGEFRMFGRPVYWQGEDEGFFGFDTWDDDDDDEEDDDDDSDEASDPGEPPAGADGVLLFHTSLDDASIHVWVDGAALRAGNLRGAWQTFSTT